MNMRKLCNDVLCLKLEIGKLQLFNEITASSSQRVFLQPGKSAINICLEFYICNINITSLPAKFDLVKEVIFKHIDILAVLHIFSFY